MKKELSTYSAYCGSNIEWLDDIPVHWEAPRIGEIAYERGATNDDGSVTQVLSVRRDVGVIPYTEEGHVGNKPSEDIRRYKVVGPDDLVLNSMNVIIGSVGLSRFTGCLSPVYYVLKSNRARVDPLYLELVFKTKVFQHGHPPHHRQPSRHRRSL